MLPKGKFEAALSKPDAKRRREAVVAPVVAPMKKPDANACRVIPAI